MPHWWCPQTGNIGEALTQLFPPCMDLSDDESISLFSKFQCSQFFIILFFEFSVIKMDIIVITCIFWNLKRSNTAVNRYTRIACRKLFISTLAHTQEYVKHMFHGNNLQVRQIDCLKYRYGVDFFVIDKLQKIQFIMIIDIVWTLWISLINYQS